MFNWFKGQEETTEKHIYWGDVEDEVKEAHDTGAKKIELIPVPGSEDKTIDGSKGVALEYTLKVTR